MVRVVCQGGEEGGDALDVGGAEEGVEVGRGLLLGHSDCLVGLYAFCKVVDLAFHVLCDEYLDIWTVCVGWALSADLG